MLSEVPHSSVSKAWVGALVGAVFTVSSVLHGGCGESTTTDNGLPLDDTLALGDATPSSDALSMQDVQDTAGDVSELTPTPDGTLPPADDAPDSGDGPDTSADDAAEPEVTDVQSPPADAVGATANDTEDTENFPSALSVPL